MHITLKLLYDMVTATVRHKTNRSQQSCVYLYLCSKVCGLYSANIKLIKSDSKFQISDSLELSFHQNKKNASFATV